MLEYILIIIAAVFVNNVVLTQFLGICPFLGVSKKVKTAGGMGGAVIFVMVISTIATSLIHKYVLSRFGLEFMQTLVFILIIAILVQMLEIIMRKTSPGLYQSLGVYLPLITTNCVVLGGAIMVIQKEYDLFQAIVFSLSTGAGFAIALTIFAGIREQLALTHIPKAMEGTPVSLITAGLLAMAFMGFSGIV